MADEVDPSRGFAWRLTPQAAEAPQVPEPTTAGAPDDAAAGAWDVPTVATPVQREEPAPTEAIPAADLVRRDFPAYGGPMDSAIDGVTEVLGAQPIGLVAPDDEGLEVSPLDSLFGEAKFVEYEDEIIPALPALPARSSGGELAVVARPRVAEADGVTLTRLQKILLGVTGGILAVLLIIVLFIAGTRIGQNTTAAQAPAEPTPSAPALPTTGPLPAGEYRWDQLLGGECITPFTSAWADTLTVVPCTDAHQAQLALVGTFPATNDPAYPGVDALQALVATACSAPTVIDYAAVGSSSDVQLSGSFAPTEADWLAGDRTFRCYVSRAAGAEFTTSVVLAP